MKYKAAFFSFEWNGNESSLDIIEEDTPEKVLAALDFFEALLEKDFPSRGYSWVIHDDSVDAVAKARIKRILGVEP